MKVAFLILSLCPFAWGLETRVEIESALENQRYAETLELWGIPGDTQRSETNQYRLVAGPRWLTLTPHGRLIGTPSKSDSGRREELIVEVRHNASVLHYRVLLRVFTQSEYASMYEKRNSCFALSRSSPIQNEDIPRFLELTPVLECIDFLPHVRVLGEVDSERDRALRLFLSAKADFTDLFGYTGPMFLLEKRVDLKKFPDSGQTSFLRAIVRILQTPEQFRLSTLQILRLLPFLNGTLWSSPSLRQSILTLLMHSQGETLIHTMACLRGLAANAIERIKMKGQYPSDDLCRAHIAWNFGQSDSLIKTLEAMPKDSSEVRDSVAYLQKIVKALRKK
jgi:hypothetical protein